MRRLLLLSAAVLVLAGPMRARAEDVSVVVQGTPKESAESYRAGGELYLEAKRVGSFYGGSVYWYPVSGRVNISVRGRALTLVAGSGKATAGDRELKLEHPVIVRASRAFVPLSLLTSPAFAEWSGHRTTFDARTKTLVVERAGTVGEARAFSYKGRTRLTVELAQGAAWRAAARGTGAAELVFDGGVAEGEGRVEVGDGVVASYVSKQEARLARLTVTFDETGQKWRAKELQNPRRVVLDVYAKGIEPKEETDSDSKPVKNDVVKVNPPKTETAGAESASPPKGEPKAVAKPEKTARKRRLIVIDAGHGGKDPGATGTRGTREKDVNLAAALELANVLKERGDFDVVMTREEDVFIPLSERSETANSKDADLFVSLHCNAASNKRENGFEVYSVSETASDPAAEALAAAENSVLELEGKNAQDETAKMILLAMTKTEMINESAKFAVLAAKAIGKRVDVDDRGAKQAGFYVLRGTHAPAILVEMAFVSHAKDEAKLASRRFRRAMAEGVAGGIADYARRQGWLE